MEIEMTALFRLSPAVSGRLLIVAAASVLMLAACTKEKPPEEKAPPAAEASASPSGDAPVSATDPAASNYPKVDPASLTDAWTIADVHNALIRPGYDVMTNAESTAPADDAGWKAVSDATNNVVKGLNLLTTGSRPKDTGDFVKFANTAAEKMKAVQALVAKKNADDLVLADGDVQEACTSCHSKYRK